MSSLFQWVEFFPLLQQAAIAGDVIPSNTSNKCSDQQLLTKRTSLFSDIEISFIENDERVFVVIELIQ